MKFKILFLTLFISNSALSEPTTPSVPNVDLGNMVVALLIVIGLIFACAWFVRRISGATGITSKHVKVLSILPLGTKEKLVLVEAGDTQILLGVTSQQINKVHQFEQPINNDETAVGSPFSEKLMALVKGNGQWQSSSQESENDQHKS